MEDSVAIFRRIICVHFQDQAVQDVFILGLQYSLVRMSGQYGLTCQKTCIVINTAARTSNAAMPWTLLA
jgi:hypothetical protein